MLKNLICSLLLPEEFAPAFAGYVVRKSGVEDAGQVSRDMYIAEVAKLVDAPGLGPGGSNPLGVRVSPSAHNFENGPKRSAGDRFHINIIVASAISASSHRPPEHSG